MTTHAAWAGAALMSAILAIQGLVGMVTGSGEALISKEPARAERLAR